MPLPLRDYQQKALDDLYQYFCTKSGNPMVVIPGGGGKSLVMAEWLKLIFELDPSARVLGITAVKELIEQNYKELLGQWPEAPVGIYSASLRKRQINSRILLAGIQSIWQKAYKVQQCDLILIDECQDIPFNDVAMYRKFLDDMLTINPRLKIIGFTATPFRNDGGYLHEGEGALFTDIAHETLISFMFEEGYLTKPIRPSHEPGAFHMSSAGIGSRAGDYIPKQVEIPAMTPEAIDAVVTQTMHHGANRMGWLVYGATNDHCRALEAEFRVRGVAVASIFGDSENRDRDIQLFRDRKLKCLVSNGVLTKGFNVKHVDLIALAMMTKSVNKYAQIILRGTRVLYDGPEPPTREGRLAAIANGPKPNFIVLDFGENIARNGPIDNLNVPAPKKKGEKKGEPIVKYCPECEADNAIATRFCYSCGYEFEGPERKVFAGLSTDAPLTPPPAWLAVGGMSFAIHKKAGKPDSLRVTYQCGMVGHSEWVCFNHTGYARTKAEGWWLKYAAAPVPQSVNEALERQNEVLQIAEIQVKRNGKYAEIVGRRIREDAEQIPRDLLPMQ